MFTLLTLNKWMPRWSSRNISNKNFYSASSKPTIIGVGVKDVPDKRSETPVLQALQEYSRFNC